MYQITKLYQSYLYFLQHLHNIKRSFFAFLFCLPTSLLALLLVLLLVYNGFSVFYLHLPYFPAKTPSIPANSSPEKVAGELLKKLTSSVLYAVKEENPPVILKTHLPLFRKQNFSFVPGNSKKISPVPANFSPGKVVGESLKELTSSVVYAVKEENSPVSLKTNLPLLQRQNFSAVPRNSFLVFGSKRVHDKRIKFKILRMGAKSRRFSAKVKEFFLNSSCKLKFFMTWISSLESFGDREVFAVESLFKSHPNACLVMVSNSLDCRKGSIVFKPFLDKGFKVLAVKPDFDYIFKNTSAEEWFHNLKKGNIDPGLISLGQNLSNLLRLSLLYKFGGMYLDTDVIVLRNLSKLRNTIGAQTIDSENKNWTRLNNAVLIFDKNHPLLFKFIQEFSLTFDGNKWGHNGPYLVSRVVSRVNGRPGFNFTVLPPSAFYPVDWSRIRSFFRGPRDELHSKWLHKKLQLIRRQSFAVHLWNRQSKLIEVEDGSIVNHLMLDCCIFCNSSMSSL